MKTKKTTKPTKATLTKQINVLLKDINSKIVKFEWLSTGWFVPKGEVDFYLVGVTYKNARITVGTIGETNSYATRFVNVQSNGYFEIR